MERGRIRSQHLLKVFAKAGSSHRAARMLFAALSAAAVIVMSPHLPSATGAISPTFTQTNLISDIPGQAKITDPNLVNPWGMTLGLNSGLWISDNGTSKATTYDGTAQAR